VSISAQPELNPPCVDARAKNRLGQPIALALQPAAQLLDDQTAQRTEPVGVEAARLQTGDRSGRVWFGCRSPRWVRTVSFKIARS
jgi:hypothetical protein